MTQNSMRRVALTLGMCLSILLFGLAVGSVLASNADSPNPSASHRSDRHKTSDEADEAGVQGGSIARFHQAGGCTLTSVAALSGNWTHGDYVSAVAATGDSTLIVEAAHSDCGKPMVSVIHGTGNALTMTQKHESGLTPGS